MIRGGAGALEHATMRALEAVLTAGRRAPTPHNTQPQYFVVVRDPARRQEIVRRAAADRAAGVLHWPMPWMAEASALIAVLYDTSRREPGPGGDRSALVGMGAVVESMRIAADAVGAAWTEWRPSEQAERDLRASLGFPEGMECHAVVGLVPERPSFPPPPSLATPFSETYGHPDPALRTGPVAPTPGDPLEVLDRRRTARGHLVSASLPGPTLRALVFAAAHAGRAAGMVAPQVLFVQSPTEIGKMADVMYEVASALFHDAEFNRGIGTWQCFDEEEWRRRGDGLLAVGKGSQKLQQHTQGSRGLWGRISAALGGSAIDDMVKDSMSELVREAPLVVAWAIDPTGRSEGRRARAAAILDAGASAMQLLYTAERLGLGAQSVSLMLEKTPAGVSGEARLKTLLGVPASMEIVNVVRVGKVDEQDVPPPLTWRSDIRRDLSRTAFRERFGQTG